jgi:hypothetical protein
MKAGLLLEMLLESAEANHISTVASVYHAWPCQFM